MARDKGTVTLRLNRKDYATLLEMIEFIACAINAPPEAARLLRKLRFGRRCGHEHRNGL